MLRFLSRSSLRFNTYVTQLISALPYASRHDPEVSSEGSIDPLGTYPVAEQLASRLGSPGVRERQRNLRFLTLCCIGWELMESLPRDIEPGDPSATLEQCFEWLVVESLAGAADDEDGDSRRGLPGIMKAKRCLEQRIHLNADRYLSMPSVFGFFGVYRTLSEYLELSAHADGHPYLKPTGSALMNIWRKEQGLPGFSAHSEGEGKSQFRALAEAFRATVKAGQVVSDKRALKFIQEKMHHLKGSGVRERAELRRLVTEQGQDAAAQNRRELIAAIQSAKGRRLMEAANPDAEALLHKEILRPDASSRLAPILDAIRAYESFIGAIHSIFDELRHYFPREQSSLPLVAAAKLIPDFKARSAMIATLRSEALKSLAFAPELATRFDRTFSVLADPARGADFLRILIAHHQKVQKEKPPKGKASWIEMSGDVIAVRPGYQLDKPPAKDGRFVYFYRARPLFDFLRSSESRDA